MEAYLKHHHCRMLWSKRSLLIQENLVVLSGNLLGITHIRILGREEDLMVEMSSVVLSEGIIAAHNLEEMVLTTIAMVEDVIRNVGSRIGLILIEVMEAEIAMQPSRELVLGPFCVDQLQMHLLCLLLPHL